MSRFPPTTEEKQKKLGGFFEKFPPPSVAGKVPAYMKAAKEKFPEVREWAILGVRIIPTQNEHQIAFPYHIRTIELMILSS